MGLGPKDLAILVDAFERGPWTEMILQVDGTRLELTSTGLPPAPRPGEAAPPAAPGAAAGGAGASAPAAAAGAPAAAVAPPAGAPAPAGAAAAVGTAAPSPATHEVLAPSVGIFYRAPEPGAPPFVEAGARVEAGATMGLVEVMKMFNGVTAPVTGEVVEVLAGNDEFVEFGQPLFRMRPA